MRVIDLSWFQYPVDTAAMAPAADGFIVRWCDWVRWTNYGGDEDTGHNDVIRGFQAQGKPASSYLFARPEMCGAIQQIDTWASRVTAPMTMPPLLDIEQSAITGNQLMDWTEEALTRMRAIWGWTPLHYFSGSLAQKLGTRRPVSPHLLMVPGYPYANADRSRYGWDRRDQWVDVAGGAGAVADYLPPGYSVADVALWQYADTALVPGTGNTVDVSCVYPALIDAIGGGPAVNGVDIVDLARTQIGVKESPPNSNQVMYWDWWGASLGAWCAVFVSYIFHEAGAPLPAVNGPLGFVSCPSGQMYAYRNNQFTLAPEAGDVIIFSWEPWEMRDGIATCTTGQYAGQPAGDHTGIFVRWNTTPGGGFTSIEGNTSQTNWDDGGAVMERSDRDASQVCCWWRPAGLSAGGFRPASEEDELFTEEQAAQLNELHAIVKGLTPTIQQSYNYDAWTHDVAKATLAGLQQTDGVVRDTFNIVTALQKLGVAGGGQPGPAVIDVEASLAQATLQQIMAALNKKLGGQ